MVLRGTFMVLRFDVCATLARGIPFRSEGNFAFFLFCFAKGRFFSSVDLPPALAT